MMSAFQADSLAQLYYTQAIQSYVAQIEDDWNSNRLKNDGYEMPFEYFINGDLPDGGYPLYISLHGGGETSAEINDEQWENQKTLYGTVDGIYFVPRSPTDTWNMWHQEYMEDFLFQIVTYSVARLNANPSRVYLLGYSAGGDGVYNLASRMSDRFGAAAMMAGHPGDAEIENLRNLPFAIYVGENDTAYNRAGLAYEWAMAYEKLHEEDPYGFEYYINIYPDTGHWMNGYDREAIGWLSQHVRIATSNRVVWIQDDVLHTHKHNLEVEAPKQGDRVEEYIDFQSNTIYIYTEDYDEVTIWLDDYIANLDEPVVIMLNDQEVFNGMVTREEQNIIDSVNDRLDPAYIYWGKVTATRE